MENLPAAKDQPSLPGVGVAGQTFCPFGFNKGICMKNACELWVELKYAEQYVGRCSIAYIPVIMTETRGAIDRLNQTILNMQPQQSNENK